MFSDKSDILRCRLKQFESQKNEIEHQIQETPRVNEGAVNFGFYFLQKKRQQIESKINKINYVLNPETIA